MPSQPADVASRTTRRHRHVNANTVHMLLRRIHAAEAADLPGGARENSGREKKIDRRVGHSLLEKLLLDNVLAVLQDERFDGEPEVVHELGDGTGFLLERRVNVRELGARDLTLGSAGQVAADGAQRVDRIFERVAECLETLTGLLESHERNER